MPRGLLDRPLPLLSPLWSSKLFLLGVSQPEGRGWDVGVWGGAFVAHFE